MSTLDEVRVAPDGAADARPDAGADAGAPVWVAVCRVDDLLPERGAAALVDGHQVALFRLADDQVHAVGNLDPFSGAQVMARGIVGSRGDRAVVTGPLYKQHFDLLTGACLEEPATRVPVHGVRVDGGVVHVALAAGPPEVDTGG